jgi:hypothetical protein
MCAGLHLAQISRFFSEFPLKGDLRGKIDGEESPKESHSLTLAQFGAKVHSIAE